MIAMNTNVLLYACDRRIPDANKSRSMSLRTAGMASCSGLIYCGVSLAAGGAAVC